MRQGARRWDLIVPQMGWNDMKQHNKRRSDRAGSPETFLPSSSLDGLIRRIIDIIFGRSSPPAAKKRNAAGSKTSTDSPGRSCPLGAFSTPTLHYSIAPGRQFSTRGRMSEPMFGAQWLGQLRRGNGQKTAEDSPSPRGRVSV